MKLIKKFARDDSGATAIEYGLIAGLIAVGIIACAISSGSTDLFAKFNEITTEYRGTLRRSRLN